jgi:hypothetical protein
MQPITFIFACLAMLAVFFSPAQAFEGTGIARVMGPEYTNSTAALEKRGRGTW